MEQQSVQKDQILSILPAESCVQWGQGLFSSEVLAVQAYYWPLVLWASLNPPQVKQTPYT